MKIRPLKPLHGWRAFVGEVGVIVLGVLIALMAQQAAQYFTDRSDAAELRQSMRDELANDRARWEAVHHDVPCALRILDAIGVWASRPGSDKVVHLMPPTMWTMHDSAWQVARSSPKMIVLPLKERDLLADLYFALEFQQRAMEKSNEAWARMTSLAQTAEQQTSRKALTQAAAEAQMSIQLFDNNFDYVEQRFARLGIRANASGLGKDITNYGNHCPPIERMSGTS